MFIQKISSKQNKGNILFGLLAVIGVVALIVVFVTPKSDVFLGAQVGGRGATVPGAPTLRSATIGEEQVSLAWNAPADDGGSPITGYSVRYSDGISPQTVLTESTGTSYTVTDLSGGTEYSFQVFAINNVGTGTGSKTLSRTPTAPVVVVPSAPENVSVTAGDFSLLVSWSAPEADGGSDITGYTISYTPGRGVEQTAVLGNVRSHTLTGLTNGTAYGVKVLATNVFGSGSYSRAVSGTPTSSVAVPDVPRSLAVTPGDSSLLVSWSAPEDDGGSDITGYTVSYTPIGGSEQTVLVEDGTSYTISGLTNGISYAVKVRAINSVGNGNYTTASSGSPDQNTSPAIIGTPSVTPSTRSAVITWSTNKNTSTRVDFGLLTTSSSTPEYNQDTRVLNHTVTILDLLPCTTYSYRVKSYDSLSQFATSSEQSFTTAGCSVTAEVEDVERDSVDTTEGGILDFRNTNVRTKLTIPQNLKVGETDVVFQVRKIERTTTEQEIGLPESRANWLGTHAYDLAAYSAEGEEEVNDFDIPLRVAIAYSREDVSGIDISTLAIHHYEDERGWTILSGCENTYNPNTGQGEISCETNSFSIFGLFGESSGSSSSSSSTGSYVSNLQNINNSSLDDEEVEEESLDLLEEDEEALEDSTEENVMLDDEAEIVTEFNRDLWFGVFHQDVQSLQRFLNSEDFRLAESGPGSPGKETSYFGPRTFQALREFQNFYRESMNAPLGFKKVSGYLDYFTRQFIQENF